MNEGTKRSTAGYQHSTNAYKYWETPIEQSRDKNRTYSKQTESQRRRQKTLGAFYLKILGYVSITVISNVLFLNSYITVGSKQTELMELTNQLREVQSDIAFTEAKISKALDISTIETVAHQKLNMSKPLPHQIEYIELP